MAPEVHELVGGDCVLGVQRQILADAASCIGQGLQHVDTELLAHLTAHLGGHVGVAVAVGADPAAGVEEGRTHGRDGAGLLAQLPVVEASVDLGHHAEERGVEDVDDGVGLLHGGRLLARNGAGADKGIDLLEHLALVLGQGYAAQARALLQQDRDAADLALGGLAARLSGMGGKDRPELQAVQEGYGLAPTALVHQLVVGHGEVVYGILVRAHRHLGLALAQRRHAVVLLADVCQVEVGHKGTHEEGRALDRLSLDLGHEVVKGCIERGLVQLAVGDADSVAQHVVEGLEEAGVGLGEDAAHQHEEELQVVAQGLRDLDSSQHIGRLRRYRKWLVCHDMPPNSPSILTCDMSVSLGKSLAPPAKASETSQIYRAAARGPPPGHGHLSPASNLLSPSITYTLCN